MSKNLSLWRALRLERRTVVSFVGAGGKTTAMFRLADELSGEGWRVVTTTTTRIAESQLHLAPASLTFTELALLSSHLDHHGHCLITGPPDGHGKMQSVSLDSIVHLHQRSDIDTVLVEADGARTLSFKAPAEHEPVVPIVTTHLIPVVGLDIVGRTLDAEYVHRPERVAKLTGTALGGPITTEVIARVLVDTQGGAKRRPPHSALVPLLNKVESPDDFRNARAIAQQLLVYPGTDAVVLCSVQSQEAVLEAWSHVAGIVLAAGPSKRFGTMKQILSYGGTTLVGHVAQVALDAGVNPVIVVTGHEEERVRAAMAGLPVQVVFNSEFAAGQSTSIRCGLRTLPPKTGAAVFLLADQPAVTAEVVRMLVYAHRQTLAPIVIPTYEGQRGNPVLFDRRLFAELEGITGDTGGRVLFSKYEPSIARVPVNVPGILQDIDTPEDYERYGG